MWWTRNASRSSSKNYEVILASAPTSLVRFFGTVGWTGMGDLYGEVKNISGG